ncbi:homoserine kinase [soil metagenome]
MAVFQPVTPQQLEPWLMSFDVGTLAHLEGIGAGIEKSNFFVTTQGSAASGEFVLTLFERLSAGQLPFYLEFMRTAAQAGVQVPAPVADRQGRILHSLAGKPACLATRLQGRFTEMPTLEHCSELAIGIARLHHAGAGFMRDQPGLMQPNLRGLDWWLSVAPGLLSHLSEAERSLLEDELQFQVAAYRDRSLPRGPIHADIFRNNVMFDGTDFAPRLGGIIDFYFAGVDDWLFDLAVAVNDWCIDFATGALDESRANALLTAYAARRAFTQAEHAAWSPMLRAAALRFWLSRLYDYHLPRTAQTLTPHDPGHFERVLRRRREIRHTLPD